ncbi:hypothetical protein ABA31_29500 [Agrococcus baldri]|uniref:Uncharacterized protein n=1 Tax=Agrococcus baldri TaxID=153730 RepID=A0AA87UTE7_9MICO|nr:hypothetical protein ABA31_29500 [Agrococcus baldri]
MSVGTSILEDLDPYPGSDAARTSTPSTAKSPFSLDGPSRLPRIPMPTTISTLDQVIHPREDRRSTPWLDAHFEVDRRTYHRAHAIVADELADVVAFLERV